MIRSNQLNHYPADTSAGGSLGRSMTVSSQLNRCPAPTSGLDTNNKAATADAAVSASARQASARPTSDVDHHSAVVSELTASLTSLKVELAETKSELDHAHQTQNQFARLNYTLTTDLTEAQAERDSLKSSSKELTTVLRHMKQKTKQSAMEKSRMRCTTECLMEERDDYRKRCRKMDFEAEDIRLKFEECKEGMVQLSFENRRLGREVERLMEENEELRVRSSDNNNGSGAAPFSSEQDSSPSATNDDHPAERGIEDGASPASPRKGSAHSARTLFKNHITGESQGHLFLSRNDSSASLDKQDATEKQFMDNCQDSMAFLGMELHCIHRPSSSGGRRPTIPAPNRNGVRTAGRRNSLFASISQSFKKAAASLDAEDITVNNNKGGGASNASGRTLESSHGKLPQAPGRRLTDSSSSSSLDELDVDFSGSCKYDLDYNEEGRREGNGPTDDDDDDDGSIDLQDFDREEEDLEEEANHTAVEQRQVHSIRGHFSSLPSIGEGTSLKDELLLGMPAASASSSGGGWLECLQLNNEGGVAA